MAATLEDIIGYLEEQELKFRVLEGQDRILTGFGTQRYRDSDGDLHLHLIIALEEEGEFFKVFAPNCYRVSIEEHMMAAYQCLLMVSWRSKMVMFELDNDGEGVCATVEFPLEDSGLTASQMMRAIYAVVRILEYYHPVIETAINTGAVDFTATEDSEAVLEMMQQILESAMEEDSEDPDIEISVGADETIEEDSDSEDSSSDEDSDDLGDFI